MLQSTRIMIFRVSHLFSSLPRTKHFRNESKLLSFWIVLLLISSKLFLSLSLSFAKTQNRPTPSSLLYTISSYIPPQFGTFKILFQTLASYWVLLSSLLNDLALLIFTVGIAILYSGWITGIGNNDSWGNSLGLGEGLNFNHGASGSLKVDVSGSGVGDPMPGL